MFAGGHGWAQVANVPDIHADAQIGFTICVDSHPLHSLYAVDPELRLRMGEPDRETAVPIDGGNG